MDRRNARYRHLLREAKQQYMLITRVDYYAVLGIERTTGDSELKKAYFNKSKEYHPDRHANAEDVKKEEFSNKFKLAKEAYDSFSDKVGHEVTECEKNPNPYFLGSDLPYS